MRKILAVGLGCLALAACGPSPTPLSRGLQAFRDGDRAALAAAQEEAQTQTQSAIQPGGDMCKVTNEDVVKYNAVYALRQLNQDGLFKLPEEARLAYALKLAGQGPRIWPDSFLRNAPLLVQTKDNQEECAEERKTFIADQMAHASYSVNDNDARVDVFNDWIHAVQAKHGDHYDDQMHAAAQRLQGQGYDVSWPIALE